MFSLSIKAAKAGFFDRALVQQKVDAATRKALNEAGRRVRGVAQSSIKMGKGSSDPGSPPHGHKSGTRTRTSKRTGRTRTRAVSLLREFIFYSFDESSRSVVIGPVRLSGTVDPRSLPALEFGGSSVGVDPGTGSTRKVSVRARPFMRPALAEVQPNLAGLWKDSVRP